MNYSLMNKAVAVSKKFILAAGLLLLTLAPNVVKAQKVGHLNFQEIVTLMPEYGNAATEYDLYQAELEDQLKFIENEAVSKQKLLEAESKKPAPSKTKITMYQKSLESLQQEYGYLQQTIQDSLKAKMADLVAPIKKKVEEAVAEIAKEQGYTHIIDNTYGTLIYSDPLYDISELVKKKLNIKPKPTANPGAGKPGTRTVTPR
jgi:outer membrane protein